jgi:hypothetical protein
VDDTGHLQEMSGAAKRRLWLLEVLLGKMEPESALALAARMEAFVAGEASTIGREANEGTSTEQASPRPSQEPPSNGREAATDQAVSSASQPCTPAERGRLLTDDELREFAVAAVNGATNRDLARRFRLSPRQANGIRMGLAKRTPQVALKRAVSSKPKEMLDRATELQLQDAFLQRKPIIAPTIDDVVRFLRQRGDVVTGAGDHFTVNHRLTLTAQELVRRANEKRRTLGQSLFPIEIWSVTPKSQSASGEPRSTARSDAAVLGAAA